ncbi:MAG: hypothetical protein ACRDAU_13790 [Clostridium sp.]
MKKIIAIIVLVAVVIGVGVGIFIYSFDNDSASTASKNTAKETSTTANTTSKTNSNSKAKTDSSGASSSNTSSNKSANTPSNTQATPNVVNTSTTTPQNNGTGDFAGILSGAKYFVGNIEGDTIIIPLNNGRVVNNQLILNEYYLDRLHEVFTLKIDSLGNNNFTFYEYYNGQNTGIFKLKLSSSSYAETLSGTYSKPGSNNLVGISLQAYLNNNAYPFYCGTVNGTPVTLVQNSNSGGYYEIYAGDNNVFNLSYAPQVQQPTNGIAYTESFNGKTTGLYKLSFSNDGTQMSGSYVPSSNPNVSYPVTFRPSFAPN